MAHKKAAGGGIRQHKNPSGKRLGVKANAGESVNAGSIIVRQKGSKFYAGKNTFLAKDFTLVSKKSGKVVMKKVPLRPDRVLVEVE